MQKKQALVYGGENQIANLVSVLFSETEFNQHMGFNIALESPPPKTMHSGGFPPWVLSFNRTGETILGFNAWFYPFLFTFMVPGTAHANARPDGFVFKTKAPPLKTLDLKVSW